MWSDFASPEYEDGSTHKRAQFVPVKCSGFEVKVHKKFCEPMWFVQLRNFAHIMEMA
jgi:hypothetical protein